MTSAVLSYDASQMPRDERDVGVDADFHSAFPMVKMPFQAIIGGIHMEGISLSLTKALVGGRLPSDLEYQDELVSLRFDFDGFSVTLFADAILSQDSSDPNGPISVYFTSPADSHLAPLRYLITSFISGETVAFGALLAAEKENVSTANDTPTTDIEPRRRSRIRGFVTRILFAALGVVFLMVMGELVYRRGVLTYEAQLVQFNPSTQTMRATAAGQIAALNPDARKGDVAFTLISNSGALFSFRMPCECAGRRAESVFLGATVLSGEPVLHLQKPGAGIQAEAQLSARGMSRVLAGDQAEVVLADGQVLPVELQHMPGRGAEMVRILWPSDALALVSDPLVAQLRFNRLGTGISEWMRALTAKFSPQNSAGK